MERPCYGCGRNFEESQMEAIDVTRDGEYYPSYIHVCRSCNRQPLHADS